MKTCRRSIGASLLRTATFFALFRMPAPVASPELRRTRQRGNEFIFWTARPGDLTPGLARRFRGEIQPSIRVLHIERKRGNAAKRFRGCPACTCHHRSGASVRFVSNHDADSGGGGNDRGAAG